MAKTNMGHRLKHATKTYGGLLVMGAAAIPIGLIVGVIDAVFGRTLLAIGSIVFKLQAVDHRVIDERLNRIAKNGCVSYSHVAYAPSSETL